MFFKKKSGNNSNAVSIESLTSIPGTTADKPENPYSGETEQPGQNSQDGQPGQASDGDLTGQTGGNSDMNTYTSANTGLFCVTATEDEAKELAAAYDIIFKEWRYGVATFEIKEGQSPYEVIQYGIDNGLTRLEIDGEVHAY